LALFLQQTQPDPAALKGIIMAMLFILPIIILVAIAIVMVPFWFILKKAGYTPWLSLLCLMPSLGTLVLLYVLAFSEWKVVPAPQPAYPPQPPYPPLPPQA
jgi:RsiW-degrading membrane proteinase PrsW (M82 family)